eukprot:6695541-Pyramimonas_sp.AAC.1
MAPPDQSQALDGNIPHRAAVRRPRRECSTPCGQSQALNRNIPHRAAIRRPSTGILHTVRPIAGPRREYSTQCGQSQAVDGNIPHRVANHRWPCCGTGSWTGCGRRCGGAR